MKKIILGSFIACSNFVFSQLEEYENTLNFMFSRPADDGWMFFSKPNILKPNDCFQYYKTEQNDLNNDMILISSSVDSMTYFSHYKFQQTYKNVPIEGAGCIEHFDSTGLLVFTNAKHAIGINVSATPAIAQENILAQFLNTLPTTNVYAWQNLTWEQQKRLDASDSNATWLPLPKLMFAIDEVRDMHGDIDGARFTLVYEIPITILEPTYSSKVYYVDAHTGNIFKEKTTEKDVTGDVYGYGNRNLDTKWRGGFIMKYELDAEDDTHNIHTKKFTNNTDSWNSMPDVRRNANNWGDVYLTETSTHYHVTNTWDYFRSTFGRVGMNNGGGEVRVKTQLPDLNAFYSSNGNELIFGKTPEQWDLGMEPSVVAHEFMHGITHFTAGLAYEFQSGALNESFSDIFGIVVQSQSLDGGTTDWVIGNHIPLPLNVTRSLSNPVSRGEHWSGNYDGNGDEILILGQPRFYQGSLWCVCPIDVDEGGVHINSGVQNNWFYALTSGVSSQNITGIGMTKAAQISYLALTSFLMSSSQYYDSKNATTQAAIQLYGVCSQEHRSTVDSWNYVGVNASHSCGPLSLEPSVSAKDIAIYPNPSNATLQIDLPKLTTNAIQVFDMNGKLIDEFTTDEMYLTADISKLMNGVYTLRFVFDGQQVVKRIVVQK